MYYKDKGKESRKYQSSQSQKSDSTGDEDHKGGTMDARNIIAQSRVKKVCYAWNEENYDDDEKGNRRAMLYPKGSQNAGTQRIQITTRSVEIRWVTRTQVVVIRLPSGSANTWRNKINSNAKLTTTPHRRSTVLVKHLTQRFYWELGRTRKSIRKKFSFNIQTTSFNRINQILYAEKGQDSTFIHTLMEYNKKTPHKMSPASGQYTLFWLAFAVRISWKS
jgi:hypothetical protein